MSSSPLDMNEAVNARLAIRFSSALAILSGHLAEAPGHWPARLHPACLAFFRHLRPGVDRQDLERFEAAALDLWERFGGNSGEPRARCDELICLLELSLAQYPKTFSVYFDVISPWLSPIERADLYRLVTTRPLATSLRRILHDIAFPYAQGRTEPASKTAKVHLTAAQREVADKLLRMGSLFFDQSRPRLAIEPRLAPLIAGKTGAGKGHVIQHVAQALGCELIHVTYGGWIVAGASSDYFPTLWVILEKLLAHKRVLLLIDELDKFDANFGGGELSGWSRSVANELWAVLDHRLPIPEFLRSPRCELSDSKENRMFLAERAQSSLWIVGVGTWQFLQKPPARCIGFPRSGATETSSISPLSDRVWSGAGISDELLGRFNPQLLELRYPTPAELEQLLQETGILALARERGVRIDLEKLNLARGGMRVVEDVVTTILLHPQE